MPDTNTDYLISLNGQYLSSYMNGAKYAPLRVPENVAKQIKQEIESHGTPDDSCIYEIASTWDGGKFIINSEFKTVTKCTAGFDRPTSRTKTDMCAKNLCTGKCRDEFMCNVVAKHILPELYKGKTK